MKKVILSVVVVALAAVVMSSCKDDPTKEKMLTNSKGWKLESATSSPAYELLSGDKISSLFDGYLNEWELDDILIFEEGGALKVDPGKKLPPAGSLGWTEKKTIGTWELSSDDSELKMVIPYMYDDKVDVVHVTTIDENTLKFNWNYDETATSGNKYTFSFTYKLNK